MTEGRDMFAWRMRVADDLPDAFLQTIMEESDGIDLCGPDAELDAVLVDMDGDAEELSNDMLSMALFLFASAHQIHEKGGDLFGVYARAARVSEAAARILARAGISGPPWARAKGVRALSLRALCELIDDQALSCRFIAHAVEAGEQATSVNSEGLSPTEWSKFRYEHAMALVRHARCEDSDTKARPILERAIDFCDSALGVLDMGEHPNEWAEAQISLVRAILDCSDIVEEDVAREMLARAAEAQNSVLAAQDPRRDADDWAGSQERLGEICKLQGELERSGKARRFFSASADARKAALRILPKGTMLARRAMNQFRLAQSMAKQAAVSSPEAAKRLQADAVKACESALPAFPKEKFPGQWIELNELLSMTLSFLAQGAKGKKGLRLSSRALEVYEEVIRATESYADPLEIAMQQQFMAKFLGDVAKCEPDSGIALSKGRQALATCEGAAEVVDSEGDAEMRVMNRQIRCEIAFFMIARTGSLDEGRELAHEALRYCDEGLHLCTSEMEDLLSGLLGYQKILRDALAKM